MFAEVLSPRKIIGPQMANPQIQKIYGPQIANPQNAINFCGFAICGTYLQTAHLCYTVSKVTIKFTSVFIFDSCPLAVHSIPSSFLCV